MCVVIFVLVGAFCVCVCENLHSAALQICVALLVCADASVCVSVRLC